MDSVLVGMFDTQEAAASARTKLLQSGFTSAAVRLTGSTDATAIGDTTTDSPDKPHEGMFARFFSDIFGSDSDNSEHRDTYQEAFKRGSFGVSVTVMSESEQDKAEAVLDEAGAVDIDARADEWRKEGWTGGVASTASAAIAPKAGVAASQTAPSLDGGTTRKLQEVEEELKVGKRVVARGGVRVFSRIIETPVQETVHLRDETADVQRRVVDRPATEADFAAFKEGSIEVRGSAEEAVVSKTARVVGEVEVGKTVTERDQVVNETLRKTKVDVENIAADATGTNAVTPVKTQP